MLVEQELAEHRLGAEVDRASLVTLSQTSGTARLFAAPPPVRGLPGIFRLPRSERAFFGAPCSVCPPRPRHHCEQQRSEDPLEHRP